MGIIKGFVRTIEDPVTPDQRITFRMLSRFELEEAAAVKVQRMSETLKAVRAGLSAEQQRAPTRQEAAAAVEEDPLLPYDEQKLLELGVTAWTYVDEEGKPVPLNAALFDDTTAPHVAREIVRFSKPSKADLGKASSPSTAT